MDRNGGIIKVKGIKRMDQMGEMDQTAKRINARGAADHLIRKRNARSSIPNASNVIKSVIEGLCAGSKRRIKTINQNGDHLSRMDLPHQGFH